jgi:hypothetical protein
VGSAGGDRNVVARLQWVRYVVHLKARFFGGVLAPKAQSAGRRSIARHQVGRALGGILRRRLNSGQLFDLCDEEIVRSQRSRKRICPGGSGDGAMSAADRLSPGVSRSNAAASRRLWISSLAGSNTAAADGLPPAADRLARFDLTALLLDLPLLPAGFFDRAFLRCTVFRIRSLLQVVSQTPSEFSPLSLVVFSPRADGHVQIVGRIHGAFVAASNQHSGEAGIGDVRT